MSAKDFDNPLVAGFGTATAEAPPLPAQQHLDATDGNKVAPPVTVQEYGSGKVHEVDSAGDHVGGGGAAQTSAESAEAIANGDYEAKGVTRPDLEAEIDRRNAERGEDDQISKSGNKGDLVAALQADDDNA